MHYTSAYVGSKKRSHQLMYCIQFYPILIQKLFLEKYKGYYRKRKSTYQVQLKKMLLINNSFSFQDPVCGSIHCSLASYWSKKLGKCDLKAYQVLNHISFSH